MLATLGEPDTLVTKQIEYFILPRIIDKRAPLAV